MSEAAETQDPEERAIDAEDERQLMARTAELLGVPVRACPIRACWRSGDCRFVDPDTFPNRPWCLDQLPDAERAGFDALYARVWTAFLIVLGEVEPRPSPDPETRELQDAALEIVATVLGRVPANRPMVRRWIRGRRDKMPALLDGAALKSYRAAVDAVPPQMRAGLLWML